MWKKVHELNIFNLHVYFSSYSTIFKVIYVKVPSVSIVTEDSF
jgi:hypothetical protein